MKIADCFERFTIPGTQRNAIRLTGGDAYCYPLYYFIPTLTEDHQFLIHHVARDKELQLYRLELGTGESVQLTHATFEDSGWVPWCRNPSRGVLDHRSALNTVRDEVIYWDGNDCRAVHVRSLEDRLLFKLPAGRIPIGQNCVTPDGQWYVYIHHDRDSYAAIYPQERGREHRRWLSKGTALVAYHLDSGEHHTLVRINSPIHHVLPLGQDRLLFCHPTNENGILMTDLRGGWYTHLRTQDSDGGEVCHYLATDRGIAYEVLVGKHGAKSGIYNPDTHQCYEFCLPDQFGYTHTGRDPSGQCWFYEEQRSVDGRYIHNLHWLVEHRPNGEDHWMTLASDWASYGDGQRAHMHPQLIDNGQWLLITAGDDRTQTNHITLVDVRDLPPTRGVPVVSN